MTSHTDAGKGDKGTCAPRFHLERAVVVGDVADGLVRRGQVPAEVKRVHADPPGGEGALVAEVVLAAPLLHARASVGLERGEVLGQHALGQLLDALAERGGLHVEVPLLVVVARAHLAKVELEEAHHQLVVRGVQVWVHDAWLPRLAAALPGHLAVPEADLPCADPKKGRGVD